MFTAEAVMPMTIPSEYKHASRDFDTFLIEARDALGQVTTNQTYTTAQAVLTVFRRRLRPHEVATFAQVLPAVLRALLIEGWEPDAKPFAFASREVMTKEAQSLRGDYNFSPDDCIVVVATTLRRHVDNRRFDDVLSRLPAEAAAFWA